MRISDWSSDVCSSDLLVDDADIETGSAHVGGDDIAQFGLQREMLAGRDSGHWPGMHRLQCIGGIELRHAAGVVADQHRLVVTLRAQIQYQGDRTSTRLNSSH